MGRKPNPLILEYFVRGPKLEDASNRYQHTCKSCGECFPKGRIDSLVNHLTKRCTSLSMQERTKIVLRLHDLGTQLDHEDSPKDGGDTKLEKGKSVSLPYSPARQGFNGLNVLAEASRQVGSAADARRPSIPYLTAGGLDGKSIVLDPALEIDGLAAAFLNNNDDVYQPPRPSTTIPHGTTAPALPSISSYLPYQIADSQEGSAQYSEISASDGLDGIPRSSDLSSIAASANETLANVMMPMEPEVSTAASENVPASLFNNASGITGLTHGPVHVQSKPTISWPTLPRPPSVSDQESMEVSLLTNTARQPEQQRASSFPRPIAANPHSRTTNFVSDTGNVIKPTKPKVRGRFDPDRRKEVQQVRKQGACIRCRMLKKPCSGETPCATCKGVESARLWKQPCIRTKIADEFSLYTVGLHSTLAFHDVNNIKAQFPFDHYSGCVEVSHFDDSEIMVRFNALKKQDARSTVEAEFAILAPENRRAECDDVLLLDGEADDVPRKTEQYMKSMGYTFFDREESHFMKSTLILASGLTKSKGDILLARVLELWTATHILADLELTWKMYAALNVSVASCTSKTTSIEEDRIKLDDATNPYSYALVCGQLRSAVEKRASQLSRSVMHDLERRLLQRQHSGWFQTFLVALILLNCIERTCWLFRTWDIDDRGSRWPLDIRPSTYANQGEHFSELLHMLLKMRSLPPKTSPRPDNGVLNTVDSSDADATQWFETINITQAFLDRRQATEFDVNDSRSLDGKYWAKILQPYACYA